MTAPIRAAKVACLRTLHRSRGVAGATKAVYFAALADVAASTSGQVMLMARIGG